MIIEDLIKTVHIGDSVFLIGSFLVISKILTFLNIARKDSKSNTMPFTLKK